MRNGNMDVGETSPSRDPSLYLLYVEHARTLQAQVIGDGLAASGRFLVRCLSGGLHWIVSAVRERQAIAALTRLDDRTLCDIGVDRAQIPLIVRALVARDDAAPRIAVATASSRPSDNGDAANDAAPHPMAA